MVSVDHSNFFNVVVVVVVIVVVVMLGDSIIILLSKKFHRKCNFNTTLSMDYGPKNSTL